MALFYTQPITGFYYDRVLESTNWADAIEEVKNSAVYAKLKGTTPKQRIKCGLSDYIEVYCGKLRKDLDFSDLDNLEIYRRIY